MSSHFNHENNKEIPAASPANTISSLPALADSLNYVKQFNPKSNLGKAVTIKGDIAAKEDMYINGHVDGKIVLKNNKLEIGINANIEANVFAKVIIIKGEVKGDVYASDQITITQSGRVFGNVYASDVSIEDGAMLKGNINMEKQDISQHHSLQDQEDTGTKTAGIGSIFKRVRDKHNNAASSAQDTTLTKKALDLLPLALEHKTPNTDAPVLDISSIGESVLIRGEFIAEEDVFIQGEIDGVIYFKNHKLVVGANAQIKANIYVQAMITNGEIKGDIYANDQIIIKKPGHVAGNLYAPRVSIESGAMLMGKIEMENQNVEEAFANFGARYSRIADGFIIEKDAKSADKKAKRAARSNELLVSEHI